MAGRASENAPKALDEGKERPTCKRLFAESFPRSQKGTATDSPRRHSDALRDTAPEPQRSVSKRCSSFLESVRGLRACSLLMGPPVLRRPECTKPSQRLFCHADGDVKTLGRFRAQSAGRTAHRIAGSDRHNRSVEEPPLVPAYNDRNAAAGDAFFLDAQASSE